MRRLGPVLTLPVALLALGACSSGSKGSGPATTTSAPSSSSSTTASTSPSEPSTTGTTGGSSTTAPTPAPTSVVPVVFTSFVITPASPVECNAPTMVELKWTAKGVTKVVLTIDGVPAATFPGGAQDHLQFFACDGKQHEYVLSAKVGATTVTAVRTVTSKPPS